MISDMIFLKLGHRSRSQLSKNGTWHSVIQRCISHMKFGIIPTSRNIGDMQQTQCQFYKLGQDHGHSDPRLVRDTLSSNDACSRQIWDSYLKWYERYAPITVMIQTRSEVEVRITVTQKRYATLCNRKMHPHTKFRIPIKEYKIYARYTIILKLGQRSRSQWPTNPKMHSYTKFGFPTSKNIEDMHQTQCRF